MKFLRVHECACVGVPVRVTDLRLFLFIWDVYWKKKKKLEWDGAMSEHVSRFAI